MELLVEEQVLQGIGMAGLICLVQSLLWVEPLYRRGVYEASGASTFLGRDLNWGIFSSVWGLGSFVNKAC